MDPDVSEPHVATGPPEVVELDAGATHALRRQVLRGGDPTASVVFDGDDQADAVHLGLRVDGRLVAVSSWIPRPFPEPTGDGCAGSGDVQLRGMATADGLRGTGFGGVLLDAGCARAAADGRVLVWARARDTALRFYAQHLFAVHGDGFVDATTQLPHHLVLRRLG
jgi:GNAT superfamily N-acetyltransferase